MTRQYCFAPTGVNLWIAAAFASVIIVGCEVATPGHESQAHVHPAEYVAAWFDNSTPAVTGGQTEGTRWKLDLGTP